MGSHARIRMLAHHLASTYRLRIFYLRPIDTKTQAAFKALNLPGAQIVSYKDYLRRRPEYPRRLSKLAYFKTGEVVDFTAALESYLKERPAHAVIFEYLRIAYIADACPEGTLRILDMHDVMSARTVSLQRAGLKASISIDAPTEKRILSSFDGVLAISRADMAFIRNRFGLENGLYVPYSVEIGARPVIGSGRRLVFVGGRSDPNITGLEWFLEQVWPLLGGAFQLDVVGTVCGAFTDGRNPRSWPGVVFHGPQEDLDAPLRNADIAINPVYVGGGLKIKCVDALAAGLPCVTTPEGAAGLDAAQEAGLTVARSRAEFARAILRLAASPAHRRAAAVAAPGFVSDEFSPEAAHAGLVAYLGKTGPDASRRASRALPTIAARIRRAIARDGATARHKV